MPCYDDRDEQDSLMERIGSLLSKNIKVQEELERLYKEKSRLTAYLCAILNPVKNGPLCFDCFTMISNRLPVKLNKDINEWYDNHCEDDKKRIFDLLQKVVNKEKSLSISALIEIERIIDKES